MKLTVSPLGHIYSTDNKEKLSVFGFQFRRFGEQSWIRQTDSVQVEMNSLEDLLAFAEKWGNLIIEKEGRGTFRLLLL
jgi:hypothetical protein